MLNKSERSEKYPTFGDSYYVAGKCKGDLRSGQFATEKQKEKAI